MSNATRIRIVGNEAAELANTIRDALADRFASPSRWNEIQGMHECKHGCKMYALKRGPITQVALIHSAAYGCALGRSPETSMVRVSVAPKG